MDSHFDYAKDEEGFTIWLDTPLFKGAFVTEVRSIDDLPMSMCDLANSILNEVDRRIAYEYN